MLEDNYTNFVSIDNKKVSISQKFSDRLKSFRENSGLTQKELGEMLGVSSNYVGMIEGGKTIEEESSLFKLFTLIKESWSPKRGLRAAREASKMSVREAAKALGIDVGVYQAIEQGTGKASERLIGRMCQIWPQLDGVELMAGSDHPPILPEGAAMYGTVGKKPDIAMPDGMVAKYVPLISWAQAGTMKSFSDESYQYEAHLAFDVTDRKAIAVQVRGDSMMPLYGEGDVVILYPSHEARNSDLVIARLDDKHGDDVMFKIFNATQQGKRVVLTSYNPAYPPLEYDRADFAWIYPAASVVKHFKR